MTDGVVDPPTYDMKFAEEYVAEVQDREKTMTIRLDAEWRHVVAGDHLRLRGPDGEAFGSAAVTRAHTLRLDRAWMVANACYGHQDYEDALDLATQMSDFYDDGICLDTDVRIIHFDTTRGHGAP